MKYINAAELPEVPNMYFIYGDGGTGKTTLLKQFEGPKLLMSFDHSVNAIRGEKDIDVLLLEQADIPVIQETVNSVLGRAIGSGRYKTVMLDNVTSLQNYVLENIDGKSKDGRQNYQKLQVWFRVLGENLRNSNVTVVATAHQVDTESQSMDGKGRFKADMNDKTFNAFTATFDFVGRIFKVKGERWIDCDPETGDHGKNRIDDRTKFKAAELINPKPLEEPKLQETEEAENKEEKE
ncbi:AAA family ATPase [Ligilactobacillus equi]|uniref:Phage nucleotide-binding protein n=1 Tax=Ligilactobacillus equi DPC 6820 TaxID=1392007 RepID=V7HW34_9LACO|nr:AAA family ATPase [Ligilactobacillus equi]ETA73480.1 phage nucleotide-binding protein [Ligilactobacillus equi DPC 6820]